MATRVNPHLVDRHQCVEIFKGAVKIPHAATNEGLHRSMEAAGNEYCCMLSLDIKKSVHTLRFMHFALLGSISNTWDRKGRINKRRASRR